MQTFFLQIRRTECWQR